MTAKRMFRFALLLAVCAIAAPAAAQLPAPTEPWKAPLGIPVPAFGITQKAGAATHYVDNSSSAATDTSNPNGSPSKPRLTVPTLLPAGAIVEVRGGPYPLR